MLRRVDFLACRDGAKAHLPAFTLQLRARDDADGGPARLGLTVTRKVGNAVLRNRVKRRLRAARDAVARTVWPAGHDIVLIAREQAAQADFAELVGQIERGIAQAQRRLADGETAGSGRRVAKPRGAGQRPRAEGAREAGADRQR